MANDNANDGALFIGIGLSGSLLGAWQLANFLGGDRLVSWQSLLDSLPVALTVLALWWYFGTSRATTLVLFLIGAWPFWWKTLDKLSAGAPDPHTQFLRMSMQLDNAWYATDSAQWLIEGLLVVALGLCVKRREQ